MKTLVIAMTLIVITATSSIAFDIKNIETKSTKSLELYNLIDDGFESTDTVTRFECLNTIMKAIGVTEDLSLSAGMLMYESYSGIAYEWSYWDGDGHGGGDSYDFINNDSVGTKIDILKYNGENLGYINLAFFNYFAKGEVFENRRYFYFERYATVKETVMFLTRALCGTELFELDEGFLIAKDFGLIKATDEFYVDGDSPITPEYFGIILERFLNQKRYLYFDETIENRIYLQKDEERSMTYLEYLHSIQNKAEQE